MTHPVKNIDDRQLEKLLIPRFMNYVRCWTESDRHIDTTPSTLGQWDLARALRDELLGLGIKEVELTPHCYVIARLPPSAGRENAPSVGFLAHIDTAGDVSGKDVKPQLVQNYNGEKIVLPCVLSSYDMLSHGDTLSLGDMLSHNDTLSHDDTLSPDDRLKLGGKLTLDPAKEPDLAAQKGKTIIHSGGDTLLGADDKAGIAEIMAAAEYLLAHPEIPHGPVEIIFSPDEETGKGLPEFPLEKIKSAACFTLDGGPMGEIETECFNAWKADVECRGKVIHIGGARGILANAALMAASFAVMLPRSESPEATDGYYGYYCPMELSGSLESAQLEIFLRDFESSGIERRRAALDAIAKAVEAQFPGGQVIVKVSPQYYNMHDQIDKQPQVLERLKTAMDNIGIEWRLKPIRGGTDGSRLTELGIPTPNIFTGGRNFHSRLEWVAVNEMCAACKVVIELIRLWGE